MSRSEHGHYPAPYFIGKAGVETAGASISEMPILTTRSASAPVYTARRQPAGIARHDDAEGHASHSALLDELTRANIVEPQGLPPGVCCLY
jgi:hypothetical protein